MRTVILLSIIAAAAALSAGEADFTNLLKDLQHTEFDVRERAAQALIKAGEAARGPLDELLKAQGSDKDLTGQIRRIVAEQEKLLASAQREQNEAAYKADYLPRAAELRKQHKDKWLTIVDGKVVPRDEKGGLAPAANLQAAAAAAEKLAPYASHRFVFKVGEEGDLAQFIGGTDSPSVVGMQFLNALPGNGWTMRAEDGSLFSILDGGKRIDIGIKGTDDRPHVEPDLSAPQGTGSVKQLFIVATGFEGTAVILRKNAEALRLTRWEVPGRVTLDGIFIKGECRRAYLKLRFPALKDPLLLPVCIWDRE